MHKKLTVNKDFRGALVLSSLLLAQPAFAQTYEWTGVCTGFQASGDERFADVATLQGFQCLIANVFVVAISLLGLAAFVMLVIASFRYLVSGGNSKGVEKAKNTITFAIVGIVVAISAYIVLNLIARFTGIDVFLEFKLPESNI